MCYVPRGTKGQLNYWVWQSWNPIYLSFILLAEPLTDKGREETGVPRENPWWRASDLLVMVEFVTVMLRRMQLYNNMHVEVCVHNLLWVRYLYILRVPNQNGVSLLHIILEIHYSGREPLICLYMPRTPGKAYHKSCAIIKLDLHLSVQWDTLCSSRDRCSSWHSCNCCVYWWHGMAESLQGVTSYFHLSFIHLFNFKQYKLVARDEIKTAMWTPSKHSHKVKRPRNERQQLFRKRWYGQDGPYELNLIPPDAIKENRAFDSASDWTCVGMQQFVLDTVGKNVYSRLLCSFSSMQSSSVCKGFTLFSISDLIRQNYRLNALL